MALRLPEPKLREMLYTGRKFTAREIESTGFFDYIVPKDQVLAKALELAGQVAAKDTSIMRARKRNSLALEGSEWFDAYVSAQRIPSRFAGLKASRRGVEAVLGRPGVSLALGFQHRSHPTGDDLFRFRNDTIDKLGACRDVVNQTLRHARPKNSAVDLAVA